MKIGIVGGGNMGCVLATKFSQRHEVTLYTNLLDQVSLYKKDMQVYLEDTDSYYKANIACITTSIKELCEKSEIIFVTFPSFLFKDLCNDMLPYLNSSHHLFFVPGSGGAELFFKDVLKKGTTISGLQRVHSVARIISFGELTKESGIRKELNVASIPNSYNETAVKVVEELYGLKTNALDNYLNITLINSNPILHTSRLYSIFKDFEKVKKYAKLPLFYEEWSVESANLLIDMDKELLIMMDCLDKNGLPVKQIKPLLEHYESTNAVELKNKLCSINSLKGLTTPSIKLKDGSYIPDLSSRYFTADYPYGLDILLAFSKFLKVECPNMEMVSNWYHKVSNTSRFFDLREFGFSSVEELIKFYK